MEVLINTEVEVEMYDAFNELSPDEQKEFINTVVAGGTDNWKDFAYNIDDDDVKELVQWLRFYNKIKEEK